MANSTAKKQKIGSMASCNLLNQRLLVLTSVIIVAKVSESQRLDDILSYLDTDDSSRPLSTCYMMDVEEMYTDDQIYMDEAGMMMIMIDDQKDYEEYFYYAESLGEQMCMPLWQWCILIIWLNDISISCRSYYSFYFCR